MIVTKDERVLTPGDPVADPWMTWAGSRILVLAQHPQGLSQVLDVLPVFDADYRVQVSVSRPVTGYHWDGMDQLVRATGVHVVAWHQAVSTPHDLIISGCDWATAEVEGPVVLLPHGACAVRSRIGAGGDPAAHNLDEAHLMDDGRVVPAVVVVANDAEVAEVARSCPAALPSVVVAGDPCFDRMLASRPFRDQYRDALGVAPGQKLVFANSTWSRHGLFGDAGPQFFTRLVTELPADEFRVVLALHPFVWMAHGHHQVMTWLAEARAAGLGVLPFREGWRAATVAADLVVGDHGSVSQYAAGLGVPVLMNTSSLADVRPGSTADFLAGVAAPLHSDRLLLPQVRGALERGAADGYDAVTDLITSRRGQSAAILRGVFYRLLGLPEPTHGLPVAPVLLPELILPSAL